MKSLIYILLALFILTYLSAKDMKKENTITNYDFKSAKQFKLIPKLNEISDITNSNDKIIFAITDEIGTVYKINPSNGSVVKRFFLGRWTAEADFEGIANAFNNLYAISSEGVLYKFQEGLNEKSVDYDVVKLPFSSKFNIEGLCYDYRLNGLLIVPKDYPGKKFRDYRTIYLYTLDEGSVNKEPIIKISLKELKKEFKVKDFYPSGIAIHPSSGNYYIVSARGDNVIVEINKSGEILGVQKLSEKKHRQPEGIAFLEDGTMIITDEAAGKYPTMTRYEYKD